MSRITPSISLNEEEQELLKEWKNFIGEVGTSEAIKEALYFARNVAIGMFGPKLTDLLQRRIRYDKKELEAK